MWRTRLSSARRARAPPRQGDEGDAIYFLDVGECVATIALLSFEVGARVEHKKHGAGTVAEVTTAPPMSMSHVHVHVHVHCMCTAVHTACAHCMYTLRVNPTCALHARCTCTAGKHGANPYPNPYPNPNQVTTVPSITRVEFDKGEAHSYTVSSYHKLKRPSAEKKVEPEYQEVARYRTDDEEYQPFFGEASLLKTEPRPRNLTLTCLTDVTVRRLSAPKFLELKQQQDHKDDLLRGAWRRPGARVPCSPM